MTVYDMFYEGPNGEIWNRHECAFSAEEAAEVAAQAIRDGSPSVEIELRRTQEEMDSMLERRKQHYASLKAS
jgi:hypothetical protein